MNQDLLNFIKDDTPKINPLIANGLVTEHIKRAETYLDEVCRAIFKELETDTGFRYLGFERLKPFEEYVEITKGRNNKPRQYNLARTDTYLVKFKFAFGDEIFERYLSLPYVGIAGTMRINGTLYHISPVLADRIISVTPPKIFIRLMSVRLIFTKTNHQFLANGKLENYPVVGSEVYKNKEKNNRKTTPMVFYLLCKYGITEMFKRFLNTDIIYGDMEDITTDKYPESKYVICNSFGIPPNKKVKSKDYDSSRVAFAIPKDKFTPTMKAVISGMYYILDMFPNEISYQDFNSTDVWRLKLGIFIFGSQFPPKKLRDDVNNHFNSVDRYIDEVMRNKFKKIGMDISDMYQLFFTIIDHFEEWESIHINHESDLYNKELSIIYYLLGDLTKQLVNLGYMLKKRNKDKDLSTGSGLKESDIKDALRQNFKTSKINQINRVEHGEANMLSYSGDNKYFGITRVLVPQEVATRHPGRTSIFRLDDPTRRLHVSMAEVRTYNGMGKSAPDGSSRINPHLNIDEDGGIIRNPELKEMLDNVQARITRS